MACDFSIIFPAHVRQAVDAGCAALDEVERLETKLSVYLEDSPVSRINRSAFQQAVCVDSDVYSVLRLAAHLSEATGGAFDATFGALVRVWGFYKGPRRVPGRADLTAARAASGWTHVVFDEQLRSVRFLCPGLEFNLGAIGKGFAIDRALSRIRCNFDTREALMSAGQSSLKGIGPRDWLVDVADPYCSGRPLARVRLRNAALGTSGTANQFFVHEGKRYGHLLDPRTGWPATGLASASAVAASAAEADALSTAFFVLGVEGTREYCRRHPDIGAVLVLPIKDKQNAPEVIAIGAVKAEVSV
jgi:thiamine biosynthesis lipoprotein